jgi:hypothetical protein
VDRDLSFSRSEPIRLVCQVEKKGRKASLTFCMLTSEQACRKDSA